MYTLNKTVKLDCTTSFTSNFIHVLGKSQQATLCAYRTDIQDEWSIIFQKYNYMLYCLVMM